MLVNYKLIKNIIIMKNSLYDFLNNADNLEQLAQVEVSFKILNWQTWNKAKMVQLGVILIHPQYHASNLTISMLYNSQLNYEEKVQLNKWCFYFETNYSLSILDPEAKLKYSSVVCRGKPHFICMCILKWYIGCTWSALQRGNLFLKYFSMVDLIQHNNFDFNDI